MSDKPKLNAELEDDSSFDIDALTEGLGDFEGRDRISFGTNLNAGVKEKLKTISHEEDIPMADIINSALKTLIQNLEEENGEYDVPKVFRVED